jgi:NitT/TauT family transport system substrate-binding protein
MKHRRLKLLAATTAGLSLVAAACGSDSGSSADTTAAAAETTAAAAETTAAAAETTAAPADTAAAGGDCTSTTDVKLQLQWFIQAQFAGYYAAQDKGFYADHCLNVEILEGGVDIVPQTVLADGGADFAIAWVPKALASREAGADIVDIAQVFQRSGTLQVSFKDKNITTPADFKGKKIGNWGFGNEYEIFAALTKEGLDPATDVTLVQQQFDMVALLNGDIDAAEAMTYNEYAQVLEAKNPATGELYTPDDFNVVSYEDVGVGMLQDAIWASGTRLSDPAYKQTAIDFVAASLEGWAYCRDNVEECRDIVVSKGSKLGASHQLWQMNEINKLIWPADGGVGTIDTAAWDRTVKIAIETKNQEGSTVITKDPGAEAYTNEIVTAAQQQLADKGIDINGAGFQPITVTLNEGGA